MNPPYSTGSLAGRDHTLGMYVKVQRPPCWLCLQFYLGVRNQGVCDGCKRSRGTEVAALMKRRKGGVK